jgi:hypothetical protein
MTLATSQLGTALCYASAIHLLFILLCSVQGYFNNGLRCCSENASQPRGTNLIVPDSQELLHPNISAKVIRKEQSIGINANKKERR